MKARIHRVNNGPLVPYYAKAFARLGARLCGKAGERMAQGIFTPYFIADNDNANGERIGGFGSTGTR